MIFCVWASPVSPFCFLFRQSVIQLPCRALEGKKGFPLVCLAVKLSLGSSPDAFCLCVTGFPLNNEARSDTSLLVSGRRNRLLSLQIRWLSDPALFIFLQQRKLHLGLLALLCSCVAALELTMKSIYSPLNKQWYLHLDIKASCLLEFKGSFANIKSDR